MSGKRAPKPTVVQTDEPKADAVVEPTEEPAPDSIEPSEPSTEPAPDVAEPAPAPSPATQEPTSKSAPASLVEVTGMGKKYFNDIKRVIPYQHTDGDPLGDTPIQSR